MSRIRARSAITSAFCSGAQWQGACTSVSEHMNHTTVRSVARSKPWLALVLAVASCKASGGVDAHSPEPEPRVVTHHRDVREGATSLPTEVLPSPTASPGLEASGDARTQPPSRPLDSAELAKAFVHALNGWTKKSSCPDFDYASEGGYQTLWCHRPAALTLRALAGAAGVPIFLSGPHTTDDETLELQEEKAFGHYNPAFVKWFADSVVPQSRESAAVRLTQTEYDVAMKPLVTAFYRTHAKIRAEPGCFERERNTYKKLLDEDRLPSGYHNRWFYFMEAPFCMRMAQGLTDLTYFDHHGPITGINGNVAMTIVGFFVRRSLDGTMPDFERALDKVVRAYEPELTRTRRSEAGLY
jgi:hypothetical protein